jgi:PAS domain S-box-containing protein
MKNVISSLKFQLFRLFAFILGKLWLGKLFSSLAELGVFQKSYIHRFNYPSSFWRKCGYTPQDMDGSLWRRALHPDDADLIITELERQFEAQDHILLPEYRILTRSGEIRWVLSKGQVVERNRSGKIVHYIGIDYDITERKRAEERISELLKEKELLLRENTHRIKNQLSMVHSFLRLQENGVRTPEAAEALREARARLEVIRSLYEKLSGSAENGFVDISAFVPRLVQEIASTLGTGGIRVHAEISETLGKLDSGRSMHLSLIINELVTNAFKYAFPDEAKRDDSMVLVVLKRVGESPGFDGPPAGRSADPPAANSGGTALGSKNTPVGAPRRRLRLQVCDNGIGCPGSVARQGKYGLGLSLTAELVEVMKGTLEIRSPAPTDSFEPKEGRALRSAPEPGASVSQRGTTVEVILPV